MTDAPLVFGLRARTNIDRTGFYWAPHVDGAVVLHWTNRGPVRLAAIVAALLDVPAVRLVMGEGWHDLPDGFDYLHPFARTGAMSAEERGAAIDARRYRAPALEPVAGSALDLQRRRAIAADLEAGELTHTQIAQRHGVSGSTVSAIRYGRMNTGRRSTADRLLELSQPGDGDDCQTWAGDSVPHATVRGRRMSGRAAVLELTGRPKPDAGIWCAVPRSTCAPTCVRSDHIAWADHPQKRAEDGDRPRALARLLDLVDAATGDECVIWPTGTNRPRVTIDGRTHSARPVVLDHVGRPSKKGARFVVPRSTCESHCVNPTHLAWSHWCAGTADGN